MREIEVRVKFWSALVLNLFTHKLNSSDLCVDSLAHFNSSVANGYSSVCSVDIDVDGVGNGPAPLHPEPNRDHAQTSLTPTVLLNDKYEQFQTKPEVNVGVSLQS